MTDLYIASRRPNPDTHQPMHYIACVSAMPVASFPVSLTGTEGTTLGEVSALLDLPVCRDGNYYETLGTLDARTGDGDRSDNWKGWRRVNYLAGYQAETERLANQAGDAYNTGRLHALHYLLPTSTDHVYLAGYRSVPMDIDLMHAEAIDDDRERTCKLRMQAAQGDQTIARVTFLDGSWIQVETTTDQSLWPALTLATFGAYASIVELTAMHAARLNQARAREWAVYRKPVAQISREHGIVRLYRDCTIDADAHDDQFVPMGTVGRNTHLAQLFRDAAHVEALAMDFDVIETHGIAHRVYRNLDIEYFTGSFWTDLPDRCRLDRQHIIGMYVAARSARGAL